MDELVLLAAAEDEVAQAIGLARRDETAGRAWESRALAVGEHVVDLAADPLPLTVRSLLRYPDPDLPLDGPADGYWIALATFALVASHDAVTCSQVGSLHDLDVLIDAAGVGEGVDLVEASRYPTVPFPLGLDVDVRIVPATVAVRFARAWLDSAPAESHTELTRFCRSYLQLSARPDPERPVPDWFAIVPTVVASQPHPAVPWPPTALPEPAAAPGLVALAAPVTAAVPDAGSLASTDELDARFESTEGLYVRDGWRFEWRFGDGLARATSPGLQGPPQRSYGQLSTAWGELFDAALRESGFPAPPPGLDTVCTLTLGTASVTVSQEACEGGYRDVVDLLEGVLATLAPDASEHQPEPDWLLPL